MAAPKVSAEFAKLMVVLAEANGARLTEERILVYAELLNDISHEELRKAVYRCCRERDQRFLPADPELRLPTVAELRSYIIPSTDDAAMQAWDGLQRAAEEIGAYASIDMPPDIAYAVMYVFGGWPSFCEMESGPALHAKRSEFIAAFRQARREIVPTRDFVRLPGSCELESARYDGKARLWAGRLQADGKVLPTMDRPMLDAVREIKQLPERNEES